MRSATPRTCRVAAVPSRVRRPPAGRWRDKPGKVYLSTAAKNPICRRCVSSFCFIFAAQNDVGLWYSSVSTFDSAVLYHMTEANCVQSIPYPSLSHHLISALQLVLRLCRIENKQPLSLEAVAIGASRCKCIRVFLL